MIHETTPAHNTTLANRHVSNPKLPTTIVLVYMLCVIVSGSAIAQEQKADSIKKPVKPLYYIGAFGGTPFAMHDVNIAPDYFIPRRDFPEGTMFTKGDGIGIMMGLLFEYPFGDAFSLGARLGYQTRGGTLTEQYINRGEVVNQEGVAQESMVEGTVDARLGYINVTPHVKIIPASLPLYFFAGPTLLLPIGAAYDYSEDIVSPNNLVFRNTRKKSRSLTLESELANTAIAFGGTVGIGLEIFLNNRFALLGDLQYAPMFGNVTSDLLENEKWSANAVQATIGFKYGFGERREVLQEPPVTKDTIRPDTVQAPEEFAAGGVTSSGLSDTVRLQKKKVKETEVHALLPYIFYEADSTAIPARYVQIDRRGMRDFRVEGITRGNTLNVYYQLLNVLGERLRDDRKAELTITGCISNLENGDTLIARSRAEAVRDYFTAAWRIRDAQLKIKVRSLPENPSLSEVDTVEGERENQRVEFSSNNDALLAPVQLPDSSFLGPAAVLRFLPPVINDQPDSVAELESWQLDVAIGDSVIERAVKGFGPPPTSIDYQLSQRPEFNTEGNVEISSDLVILDTLLVKRRRIPSKTITLVREGGYELERKVENGMYVDRYNLLLYSFDSAGVFDFSKQATAIMRERITPNSTIKILGHTDRIGLPPYNKKLSQQRAELAAQLLNVPNAEAVGLGEKELLFDNETPEGRYYSRTVTVIIETPIEAGTATNNVDMPVSIEAAGTSVKPAKRKEPTEIPVSRSLPSDN